MEKNDNNIFDEVDNMEVEQMLNGDFSKTEKKENESVKITPNENIKKPIPPKIKKSKHKRKGKPFHVERYPHTHFYIPNDPSFDAKRYLYILNYWLMSLTKLYSMLGKESAETDLKITQEIYDMILKLKDCINLLNQYLSLYYSKERDVLNEFLALNDYIGNTLIPQINKKLEAVFNCIENRLQVHDNYIGDIFNYIENIYEIIQNIVSSNTQETELIKNSDYTVTYYNGWFAQDKSYSDICTGIAPHIYRDRTILDSPSGKYYTDTFRFLENAADLLQNTQVITKNNKGPLFCHATPMEDCPESMKWEVKILDNNLPRYPSDIEQVSNMVCNVNPYSARANWTIYHTLNAVGNGDVVNQMVSFADGWNDQYYNYIEEGLTDYIEFTANTNMEMRATYVYSIT